MKVSVKTPISHHTNRIVTHIHSVNVHQNMYEQRTHNYGIQHWDQIQGRHWSGGLFKTSNKLLRKPTLRYPNAVVRSLIQVNPSVAVQKDNRIDLQNNGVDFKLNEHNRCGNIGSLIRSSNTREKLD